MTEVIVEDGQCLVDIAIQETGSMETVFDIAVENNIDPTSDLVPGQRLKIPFVAKKPQIVNYFKDREIKVVSR